MSSVVVSRAPSTSNHTPDFKPSPLKRSNANSSPGRSTPNPLHSGSLDRSDSFSSFSDTNGKKRKKQKSRDESLGENHSQKEVASSSSSTDSITSADSKTSKQQRQETATPASSETHELIRHAQEPLVKSLFNPKASHDIFNPNKSSIAALLEDPIRFHSTQSNLKVVDYKPINDPDYVSEFGSVSDKGKGKEREIQDDENQNVDEEQQGSRAGSQSIVSSSESIEAASGSTSRLPQVSAASSSSPNPNSSSRTSSPVKSQATRTLYPHPINHQFPSLSRKVGKGLNNSGNTCYLNSTLQALIHTPPLLSSLLTRRPADFTDAYKFSKRGGAPDPNRFHALNALQMVAKKVTNGSGGGGSCWPSEISGSLKQFAKPLRQGRQEDAHEFLRFLLEAMQQQCLGYMKVNPASPLPSTTLPYQIFGGRLRSRVHCLSCKANSDTFETFLDLSLDINGKIYSLDDALKGFTRTDRLEGSEKYKCEKCKRKVVANKQFTIDSLPPILTIHLKRFTLTGGKMNKNIDFQESLNLTDCLSVENRKSEPVPKYKLYAVVHHLGSGPHSGHYIATVKDADGRWKTMDDSYVSSASSPAGDRSAYILFYQRQSSNKLEQLISTGGLKDISKNSFTTSSTSSNAHASGSGPSSNGIFNQQKKRKLLDSDEEDIGQSADRASHNNEDEQALLKRSKAISSTSSVPATSFYNGAKKIVKNPLDSIEDHAQSSRSNLDDEADGGGDDDDDDSYQSLYSSERPKTLSKSQKRRLLRKEKKKHKSSLHAAGELSGVKNFKLGSTFTPGLDNLSGSQFGRFNDNGRGHGNGNSKGRGNHDRNGNGRNGKSKFPQNGSSLAGRMKRRH